MSLPFTTQESHLANVMARMTKSAVVPKMLTRGVM